MDKLNFITAGIPTVSAEYKTACDTLRELNLDGMELEFVHGVRMNTQTQDLLKNTKQDLIFTAHSPFYINLNAKEEEKIKASIERIIETAKITYSLVKTRNNG